MNNATVYHTPALLTESVDALEIRDNGIYVDATFGGGGHSAEILSRLKGGRLVAFDRDGDAENNLPDDNRIVFVRNNFRFMQNFLRYHGIGMVDGILADLGVSSHHFDSSERGFSFRFPEAPVDMRMGQDSDLQAGDVLNTYPQDRLRQIFSEYGEIKHAGRLAEAIVESRTRKKFERVADLTAAVARLIPGFDEKQFLAKMFQALRIEVNKEIVSLKHFLGQTEKVLSPKGRLAVISYHSLEDRTVKNFMKTGNTEGRVVKDFYGNEISPFTVVSKKAVVPGIEEIQSNSRARSAKLRIAEKKDTVNIN